MGRPNDCTCDVAICRETDFSPSSGKKGKIKTIKDPAQSSDSQQIKLESGNAVSVYQPTTNVQAV